MGKIKSFKKRVQEHNGITFTMYQGLDNRRAEAANQNGKFHLEGCPSVTIAEGQYKYGDEVIFQVFNKPGSMIKRERVNDNYDRIQVFFKKSVFFDILSEISKEFNIAESSADP